MFGGYTNALRNDDIIVAVHEIVNILNNSNIHILEKEGEQITEKHGFVSTTRKTQILCSIIPLNENWKMETRMDTMSPTSLFHYKFIRNDDHWLSFFDIRNQLQIENRMSDLNNVINLTKAGGRLYLKYRKAYN